MENHLRNLTEIIMKSVYMALHVSLKVRELGIPSLLDFSPVNCSSLNCSSLNCSSVNCTLPNCTVKYCSLLNTIPIDCTPLVFFLLDFTLLDCIFLLHRLTAILSNVIKLNVLMNATNKKIFYINALSLEQILILRFNRCKSQSVRKVVTNKVTWQHINKISSLKWGRGLK